jgi:hypothetical protein
MILFGEAAGGLQFFLKFLLGYFYVSLAAQPLLCNPLKSLYPRIFSLSGTESVYPTSASDLGVSRE